jgi:hypothetical protein
MCGSDRGSRAGRFREDRLRRVLPKAPAEFGRTPLLAYGAAYAAILVAAWPHPASQGARPEGSHAVSGLRYARRSGRIREVEETVQNNIQRIAKIRVASPYQQQVRRWMLALRTPYH